MKTQKPRLVSITDQYGDELWIKSASTVREELEENRKRPFEAPMASRNPIHFAPIVIQFDVIAAAGIVGLTFGLIVGLIVGCFI
jgi:hypothetical protein